MRICARVYIGERARLTAYIYDEAACVCVCYTYTYLHESPKGERLEFIVFVLDVRVWRAGMIMAQCVDLSPVSGKRLRRTRRNEICFFVSNERSRLACLRMRTVVGHFSEWIFLFVVCTKSLLRVMRRMTRKN